VYRDPVYSRPRVDAPPGAPEEQKSTGRCGLRREPDPLEVQVSSLPERGPVGELPAEGEASVLGKAEDVELLLVLELGAALLPDVSLDVAQILGLEDRRGAAWRSMGLSPGRFTRLT
jgi:hypothetical protein